ncbi:MAG TPA: type VI secretion system-associated FHA domain protein TagH [Steroidobacteraceae bacterium]|nr:type VI secretion system-associated FHA domain protein TagH [Steroidobacteraceae bacterium]
MPLKLRVISDHHKVLGSRRSQLFGVTGGRIGRSPDNDWVLPDTQHFISGHHASVTFRAGTWLLEDTSRNNVYLNDGDMPLSQLGPAKLADGDRLRIGEYEVLVTIDDHTDFAADASGQMPIPPALSEPGAARKARAQAARHTQKPRQAAQQEPLRATSTAAEFSIDEMLKPDFEATDLLVRKDAAKQDRLATSASIQLHAHGGVESNEAIADFCRGLGVDSKSIPKRTQSALMTAAGQLLRETVVQLTRTLKQQGERAGLDQSGGDHHGGALAGSQTHEATIFRLLTPSRSDIATGVDVLRDGFDRVRAYEVAYDAALASALDEVLSRINPARLAARIDQAPSRFGSGKKEKYWDAFSEVYSAIDQRDNRGWPTVLSREFAKALATQLRER